MKQAKIGSITLLKAWSCLSSKNADIMNHETYKHRDIFHSLFVYEREEVKLCWAKEKERNRGKYIKTASVLGLFLLDMIDFT